ncbi:MAG: DUF167 family protein [Chlamydiota bacterium]|nr:DUF167 family protein [Chlamydiota bacterium]
MILKIKVIPNSSQNKIVGFEGEVLKIKCTATPEKGKANAAIISLLSKYYNVPKSAVTILKGETHTRKIIEIQKPNNCESI